MNVTVIRPLPCGKVFLFDLEDYDYISRYSWCSQNGRYVKTRLKPSNVFTTLHKFLMNTPPGMTIDHINGNGFDNRRKNLRLATKCQNQANRKAESGYKGVCFAKRLNKWRAAIRSENKVYHLGVFENEIDAAKAYDAAAHHLHGKYAKTNF